MGSGNSYKCKKCGSEYAAFTGIGFLYPQVCRDALERMQNGEYGEEWKKLVLSYKYPVVDAEDQLYCCECGHWEVDERLDLYVPKHEEVVARLHYGEKTVEEWGYVPYLDHETRFRLLKKYPHVCPDCGKEMKETDSDENTKLKCPECGTENLPDPGGILWD